MDDPVTPTDEIDDYPDVKNDPVPEEEPEAPSKEEEK